MEITALVERDSSLIYTIRQEYACNSVEMGIIITGSGHNGVNPLDGDTWESEPRISSADGYSTGKFSLNAPAGGNIPDEATLFSLAGFKKNFPPDDLQNISMTASKLKNARAMLASIENSYEARAGLYASEAAKLERQADILDEAAQTARPGDEQSLKDAVLGLLLRDQGNLLEIAS